MNPDLAANLPEERPCARFQTRCGITLRLHPAEPLDGAMLGDLLTHLPPGEARFRFPVAAGKLPGGAAQPHDIDHRRAEHVVAIDETTGRPAASMMIAADAPLENAEVVVTIAPEWRGRGIGWIMLKHAAQLARQRGIRRLRSIECLADVEPDELDQALEFVARPFEAEPDTMLVEANLA